MDATTHKFFFAAWLCVVLCPLVSNGEDVLALKDGTRYTNVVFVTNKAGWIDIKHDGGRSGVKISNLPSDFLTKYGLQEPTNLKIQQTSSIDYFFSQHLDSKLEVEKRTDGFIRVTNDTNPDITEDPGWSIKVTAKGLNLELGRILWSHKGTNVSTGFLYSNMEFGFSQEALANQIFSRFIEWENVAVTNNVEPFKKELASFPDSKIEFAAHTFTFSWQAGKAKLDYSGPVTVASFSRMDVNHFGELLKFVPNLKQELAQKIRNQEAQKDLFK